MELTREQVELGAMFLAASNTGLVGGNWPMPKNVFQIETIYRQIDSEYENELGEGLKAELDMFKSDILNGQFVERLQETVPFIFE